MSELLLVPATEDHAAELALSLRPEDAAEVLASGFEDAREACVLSVQRSHVAIACLVDGRVAALFGLREESQQEATVWFLTGDLFLVNARLFVARAKSIICAMRAFGTLSNYVDARYDAAIRWVKWLGFEVGEAVPFGPAGQLFHLATLRSA